jgi:hypothetical protein
MKNQTFPRRWLILPVLAVAFCSRGNSPSLTVPSNNPAFAAASGEGLADASAVGDVKVGSGPLEMVRLRMDRQTSSGASVLRQYADPGQSYPMNQGETIELWAEYPATVLNPRFKVEWGDGAADNIGCGACLLKHSYPSPGLYTVKASLDDRVSTTVTRTFVLDSRIPAPALTSACAGNPLWQPVTGTTANWVWSSDRTTSTTVALADANHSLWVGDQHTPVPNTSSLDGTGWVSTAVFTMSGCDASWYHLGGSFTGACGGHDGDQIRRLTMNPQGCFDYTVVF